MKLFVILLVLAGGYAVGLSKMSEEAFGQLNAINQTYTNVAAGSEAWSAGDTSGSIIGR